MTFQPRNMLERRLQEVIIRYEESGHLVQYRQWQGTVLLGAGRPISVAKAIRQMEVTLGSCEDVCDG